MHAVRMVDDVRHGLRELRVTLGHDGEQLLILLEVDDHRIGKSMLVVNNNLMILENDTSSDDQSPEHTVGDDSRLDSRRHSTFKEAPWQLLH